MYDSDSSSDSEDGFRINQEYAEKYDKWRQKEELQKLKDKYGDISDDRDESSSESEDEDAEALTNKLEKEWLQTLSALKHRDPKIYDKNTTFYADSSSDSEGKNHLKSKSEGRKSSKKTKPYLLKDYERDLIVEKEGKLSESEDEDDGNFPKSYHEEQDDIKESFKSVIGNADDSDSEEFLTKRKVSKAEKEEEDKKYNEWLKKQKPERGTIAGMDPWDKPHLDDNEKFLRDYILNKRYKDESDDERIPTYDEIVNIDEEEEELEKQEHFERKYNFRYEEPDQDFIKSYPRTIGETVRRKDDRRAEKRQAAKERKLKEKKKKKEELKQLKNLKKKEIMDKIDLIKEVTGNVELGFAPEDIDEDFDPEKYDQMMKKAFNDEYYDGDDDDEKPIFKDDEELDLDVENWDEWAPGGEEDADNTYENSEWDEPEPEPDMGGKKRKRKSKFAKAISKKKPVFDPNDKTFEQYLDEYYKLDYEDMIGDQPCRFKYRSVVPNDFGLSTGDVLEAKDKELNQWVSVKKMSQYRTKEEELIDVKIFQKKAKRKSNVLLSLQETKQEKQRMEIKKKGGKSQSSKDFVGKGKKRKFESNEGGQTNSGFIKKQKFSAEDMVSHKHSSENTKNNSKNKKTKKKQKGKHRKGAISDERLKAYGINPKKFKYTKNKFVKK